MSKKYNSPAPAPITLSNGLSDLPTNYPIAVYYRQSTEAQVGNISTSIQTVDMVAYLTQKGWIKEHIYMIDMDAGVSGMTKIDERPGMKYLFDLITRGEIRAVACQDEDRLFRDVTQIQVNIFIEACRASNVLVITPNMVYDFANELTGSFHARQFRFKSEMAAEYINTVILGKLNRAKRHLLMEGRWAGFAVLPGFMVDVRKHLPDGTPNPNWRRYVPFPEYAEVVREYFRLFLSYAGNVHATLKHIQRSGPFYPDPDLCRPPEGYKFVFKMKKYARGYCPGRRALVELLTNALVLGHWSVNNTVVRWNNHPPIIEEKAFWQAFNYLSQVTLDGQPNPYYKPFSVCARPLLEQKRSVERPLCAGMVFSQDSGELRKVGTVWIKSRQEYIYVLAEKHPGEHIIWRRTASFIDSAITALVHEKLKVTFDETVWEKTIAAANLEYEEEKRRKYAQLATLERVMQSQVLSLEAVSNLDMIQAIEARYEEAQREHKRLTADLAAVTTQAQRLEALKRIKENCDPTLESWDTLLRDEQRAILHTFIDHIQATQTDGTGIRLIVQWIDGSCDTVVLAKQTKNGWRNWLESETNTLLHMVATGAEQVEIAAAFPSRTWKQIMDKIAAHLGYGTADFALHPIREDETYEDFAQRAGDLADTYQASSADRWSRQDSQRLETLFEQRATKLSYLEAFPYRNWLSIAKKLRCILGDIELPVDSRIRKQDTLATFTTRFGHDQHDSISSECLSSMAAAMPSCSA